MHDTRRLTARQRTAFTAIRGSAIQVGSNAIIVHSGGTFNACDGAHWFVYGTVEIVAPYTISGNAAYHMVLEPQSNFNFSNGPFSVAVVGTPDIFVGVRQRLRRKSAGHEFKRHHLFRRGADRQGSSHTPVSARSSPQAAASIFCPATPPEVSRPTLATANTHKGVERCLFNPFAMVLAGG